MDSWQRPLSHNGWAGACSAGKSGEELASTDLVFLSAEPLEVAPCYFVHGIYSRISWSALGNRATAMARRDVPVSPRFAAVS